MLSLFIIATLAPPLILIFFKKFIGWKARYLVSLIPALYTGAGALFAQVFSVYANCQGNLKDIHDCILWGRDISNLIDYAFFLEIWFIFAGFPISVVLCARTYEARKASKSTDSK